MFSFELWMPAYQYNKSWLFSKIDEYNNNKDNKIRL
jgi:hypothetical protein